MDDKIFNPETKRFVSRTGAIGKKILAKLKEPQEHIKEPPIKPQEPIKEPVKPQEPKEPKEISGRYLGRTYKNNKEYKDILEEFELVTRIHIILPKIYPGIYNGHSYNNEEEFRKIIMYSPKMQLKWIN